jgi:hypothetical protein
VRGVPRRRPVIVLIGWALDFEDLELVGATWFL